MNVIARVLKGDRNAFGTLISRYSDPLYRHALGMTGSPDVAEDILQASFIKAHAHLAEVHGRFECVDLQDRGERMQGLAQEHPPHAPEL